MQNILLVKKGGAEREKEKIPTRKAGIKFTPYLLDV